MNDPEKHFAGLIPEHSNRIPSRAEAWVAFAAGAAALTKSDYPIGGPGVAGMADALLAEYEQRFLAKA